MTHTIFIPLLCTASRFFLGSLCMPYVILAYVTDVIPLWFTLGLYVLCAATDFFDGFYARFFNACTQEGGIADSIADKSFFFAMLFVMTYIGALPLWFVLISMMRECFVVGLRMVLLSNQKHGLKVLFSAKIKTTLQHVLFMWLIAYKSMQMVCGYDIYMYVYVFLLSIIIIVSLYSAVIYTKESIRLLK